MAELVGEQKLCILNQMSFTCAANELPKYSPSFIFMQAKLLYILSLAIIIEVLYLKEKYYHIYSDFITNRLIHKVI